MSDLKQKLLDDMKQAMREKSTVKLETIRMVRAAVQRKEVDERVELDDNAVLQVLQKMVKQCKDAADQFTQGGRDDLSQKELANIEVMEAYLPSKLSDSEIDSIIQEAIQQSGAESMKDMGKVMGVLRDRVQGRADMGALSGRIKALLG
ncbi:MAG: GatB/YqeY domain-containing protein [Arenicellales bacterium]